MIAEDINIIRNRFVDQWPFAIPATFANAPNFDPPSSEWVRLIINPPETEVLTMGPHPIERAYGSMILQIFVPTGTGDARAFEIADIFAVIFRNWSSGAVICGTPKATVNTVERQYFSVNVRVTWRSDHIY